MTLHRLCNIAVVTWSCEPKHQTWLRAVTDSIAAPELAGATDGWAWGILCEGFGLTRGGLREILRIAQDDGKEMGGHARE
jgi:hypothetical protein